MTKVLGIDLGTGFSCISIYEKGNSQVINNAEGARTTPSIVGFTKTGERLVGTTALRQAITNPEKTISSVKRLIGRKFSEVQNIVHLMPYKIIEGKNGDAAIQVDDKTYTPEEISSMVLAKLKADAEAFLGETIKDAVITVPAYFNDSQRKATQNAGTIAGLNVLRIINEPTAAALAYGIDKKKDDKVIAVFDIGKGTSDISILDCGDGVFEVLATNGDSLLGGADFDEALVKYVAEEFKKESGIDLMKDRQALQRLTEAAEKAKIELSTASTTEINLPFISMNASGPVHLVKSVSRAKFEELVSNVFDKFGDKVKQCLIDSKKEISEINEVILVGGSTRVPYIQEFAKKMFNKEPNKSVNPDEAVSIGAAIQGAVLNGDTSAGDVVLLDVNSLSIGIETMGEISTKMIPRNTTIPTKKTEMFSTAQDNQPSVTIRVLQGERERASDNKLLGQFNLDGIAPAPRGVPQIEVTFELDANGVLTVTAKDKGTGKEQHITIESKTGLSDEEVERLVKEAELHAEEDKKFKEEQTLLNEADSMVFNIEKTLKENEGKLPADIVDVIKPHIEEVKKYKDVKDIPNLKNAVQALRTASMKIGEELYKQQQATQQATNQTTENAKPADDGVIDAEVVE